MFVCPHVGPMSTNSMSFPGQRFLLIFSPSMIEPGTSSLGAEKEEPFLTRGDSLFLSSSFHEKKDLQSCQRETDLGIPWTHQSLFQQISSFLNLSLVKQCLTLGQPSRLGASGPGGLAVNLPDGLPGLPSVHCQRAQLSVHQDFHLLISRHTRDRLTASHAQAPRCLPLATVVLPGPYWILAWWQPGTLPCWVASFPCRTTSFLVFVVFTSMWHDCTRHKNTPSQQGRDPVLAVEDSSEASHVPSGWMYAIQLRNHHSLGCECPA